MNEYKYLTTGTVVFNRDLTKVALIKRPPNKAFPNKMALPGGKVLTNEGFSLGAKREVLEEIGLDLDQITFSGVYESHGYLMLCYYAVTGNEDIDNKFWNTLPVDQNVLAPNVYLCISNAYDLAAKNKYADSLMNIKATINEAKELVADSVKEINKEVGWDHFLNKERIGIIGSSVGGIILSKDKKYTHIVDKIATTIYSKANSDGGWPTKTIAGPSMTESTYYSVKFLLECQRVDCGQYISNGLNWFKSTVNSDGGWGSTLNSRSRVLTTTMALSLLKGHEYIYRTLYNNGVFWLLNAQKEDGSWGAYSSTDSDASNTARAVLTLININDPSDEINEKIQKGIIWLKNHYTLNNSWINTSELEYVKNDKGEDLRHEFKHSARPLSIMAILKYNFDIDESYLIKEIGEIVDEGLTYGCWKYSLTPGHIPIWHILDNLDLLHFLNENATIILGKVLSSKVSRINPYKYIETIGEFVLGNYKSLDKEKSEEISQISLEYGIGDFEGLKYTLKDYISKDQADQATKFLMEFLVKNKKNEKINELFLLQGRLEKLSVERRLGTISNTEYIEENSKLSLSLMRFIDSI